MSEPLLVVEGLSAFYGRAQAIEDVSFAMEGGSLGIIGRNGMGKTTLCNAIMGIPPARLAGSIRYRGTELVGRQSYRIANLGIGFDSSRIKYRNLIMLGNDPFGHHEFGKGANVAVFLVNGHPQIASRTYCFLGSR